MKILAVHSSSFSLCAAVVEDEHALLEESLPPERRHVENVAQLIKGLVDRLRIRLKDIDGFAVAKGPGSFSGIRVGAAVVKGMATALGKPACGIGSLEITAMQGLNAGELGGAVIDARRSEIYAALYKKTARGVELWSGPTLSTHEIVSEWANRTSDTLPLCGEPIVEQLAESMPQTCEARIVEPSATACALLALPILREGRNTDAHAIAPLYIRKSDAEEKRR